MHRLRILTFNWHDPYIYLFARTSHDIHVGDWMQRADGTRGWDLRKRPVPSNVTLIDGEEKARAAIQNGSLSRTRCRISLSWSVSISRRCS